MRWGGPWSVVGNADGNITGCTADAVEPMGCSLEALRQELAEFQAALELPVLTLTDVPVPAQQDQPTARTAATLTHEQVLERLGLSNDITAVSHKATR